MDLLLGIILIIVALVLGIAIGGLIIFMIPAIRKNMSTKQAQKIIRDAEIRSEHIVKNAQLDGKQIIIEMKNEVEKEFKDRRSEIAMQENKLLQREQSIDNRDNILLNKEQMIEQKGESLNRQLAENQKKEKILQEKIDGIISELENVSKMSTQEARNEIMQRVEGKMSKEIALFMKSKEEEANEEAEKRANEVLSLALTRYAQDVTTERTVSTVALPNDEMKGRIIGREGRNIRTLEQLLGVDLIIDDTPEIITISCFNPIRREIARRTLEHLIKDGRIQPGRIEELVEKSKKEVDESVRKAGEEAAFRLGLPRINKELLDYVGRLKYRTSYGQNALEHAIEVANLTGIMAAELGLDQNLAKRAGLLHDIGKAADFELEGSHVEIGARLAKKYGENDVIVNSIESHHGDVEPKYVISNLVQAADTLSAARPGARRETLETYIKRIEQLEEITKSYDGVYQSYAMQSGREIRVMVLPDKIDDLAAFTLARNIKDRIENEMSYPGQIKVSVIREYRAVETAK
jgi:ribonuclease Y